LVIILSIFSLHLNINAQLLDVNKNFESFKKMFLKSYWELNPVSASYQGLTEHDAKLVIPTEANRATAVGKYETFLRL